MSVDVGYRLEVSRADVGLLVTHLEESEIGTMLALEVVPIGSAQPARLSRLGLDRRLRSVARDSVILAISGGGSVALRALAAIIRDYIQSRKTTVKLHRRDGDVLELEGTLSVDDIERLLQDDGTHGVPTSDEA